VKCGKKCGGCPHGPYWYAYWREGKRLRKRYVGKGLPGADGAEPPPPPDPAGPPPDPLDAIFSDRTATIALAREILGVPPLERDLGAIAKAYRAKAAACHPDRCVGQDDRQARRVNAAYSYLRRILS
jgi:hypothetical protein